MSGDAQLPALPVTVIGGYLGAGKTSLVNHLLRHANGRRILVMVNDFGALNIDADLIESRDEDTITLANGCICCGMGTELLYAFGDALDRRPRPDALVIEASGVALPDKIAAVAQAEPEMRYAGIVTLADAVNLPGLLADAQIGAQVAAALTAADLIVLTKSDLVDAGPARCAIAKVSAAPVIDARHGRAPVDLLLDPPDAARPRADGPVQHSRVFTQWSTEGGVVDRAALLELLSTPPRGLYRFKGRLALTDGSMLEVHLVGRLIDCRPVPMQGRTRAVAIGLAPAFDSDAFESRWDLVRRAAVRRAAGPKIANALASGVGSGIGDAAESVAAGSVAAKLSQ
ncbi:MAG: CobW family GTP-binding protein [Pseudomonadota bacterium]